MIRPISWIAVLLLVLSWTLAAAAEPEACAEALWNCVQSKPACSETLRRNWDSYHANYAAIEVVANGRVMGRKALDPTEENVLKLGEKLRVQGAVPIRNAGVAACSSVYEATVAESASDDAAHDGPGNASPREPEPPADPRVQQLLAERDPRAFLLTYSELEAGAGVGHGHVGATEVATELAQSLGQIVATRAARKGLALAKAKLSKLLCEDSELFTRTCQVLDRLSMRDLATSPKALRSALVEDLRELVEQRLEGLRDRAAEMLPGRSSTWMPAGPPHGQRAKIDSLVAGSMDRRTVAQHGPAQVDWAGQALGKLFDVTVEVLLRGRAPLESDSASLVDFVVELGRGQAGRDDACFDDQAALLVTATAAWLRCEAESGAGGRLKPRECPVAAHARAFALSCHEASLHQETVVELAVALQDAASLEAFAGGVPAQQRLARGIDALFIYLGYVWRQDPARLRGMQISRSIVTGVLEKDANLLVLGAIDAIAWRAEALEAAEPACGSRECQRLAREHREQRARIERGLRVMTALLRYSTTYSSEQSEEEARRDRREILEAFTEEMTSREGRRGDAIVSLGGSLRLNGGVRTNFDDEVVAGPIGLPLGFGFQYVPRRAARPGVHLEASLVDLGQYVSFARDTEDDDVVVAEPAAEDLLAPSLTAGVQWGTDLPVFLGGTVGWAPHYSGFGDEATGAMTVGVSLGVYVPLYDLN